MVFLRIKLKLESVSLQSCKCYHARETGIITGTTSDLTEYYCLLLKVVEKWLHSLHQTENELTVLQNQHRTTAVRARKSPGSHQTEEKTGTYELEKRETLNSMWFICKNNLRHTVYSRRRQTHTSSPLPQSPESLLSHNLPEAIDDSWVSGLSCPRCNLQTCLDDVSRRHEGCRRDTWEAQLQSQMRCCYFKVM